ncbi:MAG: hypothetical protein L0G22_10035 [Propionibacteriaceae bacterium]|nr:hypothetical protein [Propionibacteriaceae bacterium]
MTNSTPAPRGNLVLGIVLGAVVGILLIVVAWLQLVPRTAEPAESPAPTAESTPTTSPTQSPTSAPTGEASEHPEATPTISVPGDTPSAEAPDGTVPEGVVTELPAGSFVTVLRSLPQGSVSAEDALAQAAGMGNEQHRPVVLDSNSFGFTANYWVIAVPGADSSQAAVAVCEALGIGDRNQCYPRQVRG